MFFCQGTTGNRIVLTKLPSSTGEPDVAPSWPEDIRLVDESSVYFGRLQIKYHEKWRGICANFQKYVNYFIISIILKQGLIASWAEVAVIRH